MKDPPPVDNLPLRDRSNLALGQAEHAFAQDVALNLVSARVDHRTARLEHPPRPDSLVYRESVAPFELCEWSQHLHREGRNLESQFGGAQLDHRAFRPGRQPLQLPRELAESGIPDRGRL